MASERGCGDIQDDAFHPWDRTLPLLPGIRRASNQASKNTVRTEIRDTSRIIDLTGMRTVLIPRSFRRWTSSSVNQVCQCWSKISSAVSGFALVRSLSIRSDGQSLNVKGARDGRTIRTECSLGSWCNFHRPLRSILGGGEITLRRRG